jgi:anthranilate phosphoribosyltransferase
VEELEGFRDAMLERCVPVDLHDYNVIDVCGTGGDNKNTFNISTTASFVAAGAGIHVAKHGNYGVSSVSGSSNVLEYFGYKFTSDINKLKKSVEEAGICFMHAPLFHPAMKHVAPIRREMAVKTFFNMLGPMVNPAFPPNQMVGVFSLELARLYGYLYQNSDKNYSIVHSLDVYDEISLTSDFKLISQAGERLLSPESLGFSKLTATDLLGGDDIPTAAKIVEKIIRGEGTPAQNSVVIANAGLAIHCVNPSMTYQEAFEKAKESLESGKALNAFKKIMEI